VDCNSTGATQLNVLRSGRARLGKRATLLYTSEAAVSEASKRVAERWFEQVWNQKSEAAIDELFFSGGKCYGFPEPDSALSPEEFKALHRNFCGAFPDFHAHIEDLVAEGDHVAVRWKITMTHLGDHLGFPASGKQAVLHGSSFIIVKNGQIMDGWNQMDMTGFIHKLQA
jgi:steroid delta-isomerase-like uncharacterized protein